MPSLGKDPKDAKKYGRRYPWEKWLKKPRTTLRQGKDFDCNPVYLRQMLSRNLCIESFRRRCKVEKGAVSLLIDDEKGTTTIVVRRRP